MKKRCQFNNRDGFSLLEISVVLVIISTLVGGGITALTHSIEQRHEDITRYRMAVIQKTLLDYRRAFHSIPCPSILSLATTNAKYGRGDVGGGGSMRCDEDKYGATYASPAGAWGGGVPVHTLKLPEEYAFDGWGRRFTYYVDDEFASLHAFADTAITASIGDLTVLDNTGATITDHAAYVLFSHGPNGHGAYSRNGGTRISSGSTNTNENENCDCTDLLVPILPLDRFFVQSPYMVGTVGSYTNVFDDILVYGTRASLRAAWE